MEKLSDVTFSKEASLNVGISGEDHAALIRILNLPAVQRALALTAKSMWYSGFKWGVIVGVVVLGVVALVASAV